MEGTAESKASHDKIRFCGEQARRDGMQYFWVDTCCINKSNNNELSEAINSMFRWYLNAVKCYAFCQMFQDLILTLTTSTSRRGNGISEKQMVHSGMDPARAYCSQIS
jgi:hypothetical protein